MSAGSRRDELDQVAGQVHKIARQLLGGPFGEFCPVDSWLPSVNVYRLPRALEVCLDLAGVERSRIDVRVQPGSLTIRGHRAAPEPRPPSDADPDAPHPPMRILGMEIDHGPFSRTIPIPEQVDLTKVSSEYRDGLLWVRLPFRDIG